MTTDKGSRISTDKRSRIAADKGAQVNRHNKTHNDSFSKDLLYAELSYKIRAAFFEVYNSLGPGFKETIYHKALTKEFALQQLSFVSKKKVNIYYKGETVGIYEPDFIVEDKVLIEIKAVPHISKLDELQLSYYLRGTKYKLGFLVNFGGEKIDIRRHIFDEARNTNRR